MIGLIRFDFRGGTASAVLGDDGCWSCAALPCLVHPLDILYSPNWGGLPDGRRYLEAAARWLEGTVVFEAGCPIPPTARPWVRRVSGNLFVRRCRRPAVSATERPDRVTELAAAQMCSIGVGMIRLWVETGAWPMPRRDAAASPTFGLSDVEGWLATGTWPAGAHFQAATAPASLPFLHRSGPRMAPGRSRGGTPGPRTKTKAILSVRPETTS